MPLVWAHAEYIKLLRSVTDGRVFDRVDAVAERYATPRARGTIEVWRRDRQVPRMSVRRRLRVEAEERFELRWSVDGWKTAETTEATGLNSCGFYADAVPGKRGAAGVHAVLAGRGRSGRGEIIRLRWSGKRFLPLSVHMRQPVKHVEWKRRAKVAAGPHRAVRAWQREIRFA